MSHNYLFDPHKQPMASDSTTVPTTTEDRARRQRIRQDWANVGLSADIMRPRPDDTAVWPGNDADEQDWQQQSYCCR